MSYSWDRFMIDPAPGPRCPADFEGLTDRDGVAIVTPSATLRNGMSTLPRLSTCIELPLVLLDAEGGATGMAALMTRAAKAFDADELLVVDVGGDILAKGREPGLNSPLADSLALAAAFESGLPTRVLVAGPAVDGELSIVEVLARLDDLHGHEVGHLTADDVAPYHGIWSWHPSEATALLATAAGGWRGVVETQRRSLIQLSDIVPRVFEVEAPALLETSLAAGLVSTESFEEAEQLLRDRRGGRSELDIERRRSVEDRSKVVEPSVESLEIIDRQVEATLARGVDALTLRRVAEMVSAVDPATTSALRRLLAEHRGNNFRPPIYILRAGNPGSDRLCDHPSIGG